MPKPVKFEDTEVVASPRNDRRQRRRFTPEQKLKIVQEADAAKRGEVAIILRREGIYSSQLADWRAHLKSGGIEGLKAAKPGRKGKDERDRLIEKQQWRIEQLEKQARINQGLIDMQIKAHEILGIALPRVEDREMAALQESSSSALRRSR